MKVKFKIRKRERRSASPKPGERQSWTEWQIVQGRRVVARCGTEQEARRNLAALLRLERDDQADAAARP